MTYITILLGGPQEKKLFVKIRIPACGFSSPLSLISIFICVFSSKEICVQDYFSNVKYEEFCATINPSTSKILKIANYSKYLYNYNEIGFLQKQCFYFEEI